MWACERLRNDRRAMPLGSYVRVKVMDRGPESLTGYVLLDAGRGEGGYIEERFLHFVSRLLRRSEGEEEASAYFGRNDRVVGRA